MKSLRNILHAATDQQKTRAERKILLVKANVYEYKI